MDKNHLDFNNKKILITAGPTREAIDPVRYLSNHSSGKMGYSLAEAAIARGAEVILVTGPTALVPPVGAKVYPVNSALEMFEVTKREFVGADIIIGCAAVADYRPAEYASQKIKKNSEIFELKLIKNPDIIDYIGHRKEHRKVIGFAAESQDEITYGKSKLQKKNLDMICINNISNKDIGFGSDNNEMTLITVNQAVIHLEQASKIEISHRILDTIRNL